MSDPDLPHRPLDDGPTRGGARGRRLRRIRLGAYAVSAVVHLLALLLYPRLFGGLPEIDPGDPAAVQLPSGMEVLNLVEVDAPDAPAPAEVEPPTERVPVPVPPRPRAAEAEAEPAREPAERTGSLSAAERLQPSTNDGRLWQPLPDEITALTPEQRIENLLYARLLAENDSVAAAALREAGLKDWTYTDDEGRRWGISSEGIHLGDLTLPLPMFGSPAGASDDMRRLLELEAEIRRAAGQGGLDETARERAEEIRKRRDEERRRPPPDTTRSGGR